MFTACKQKCKQSSICCGEMCQGIVLGTFRFIMIFLLRNGENYEIQYYFIYANYYV